MMRQFTITNGYLCVLNVDRYDAFYGFSKPVKKLYETKWN